MIECETCPKCHSGDYNQHHHEGDMTAPECDWWVCEDFGYESEPE